MSSKSRLRPLVYNAFGAAAVATAFFLDLDYKSDQFSVEYSTPYSCWKVHSDSRSDLKRKHDEYMERVEKQWQANNKDA